MKSQSSVQVACCAVVLWLVFCAHVTQVSTASTTLAVATNSADDDVVSPNPDDSPDVDTDAPSTDAVESAITSALPTTQTTVSEILQSPTTPLRPVSTTASAVQVTPQAATTHVASSSTAHVTSSSTVQASGDATTVEIASDETDVQADSTPETTAITHAETSTKAENEHKDKVTSSSTESSDAIDISSQSSNDTTTSTETYNTTDISPEASNTTDTSSESYNATDTSSEYTNATVTTTDDSTDASSDNATQSNETLPVDSTADVWETTTFLMSEENISFQPDATTTEVYLDLNTEDFETTADFEDDSLMTTYEDGDYLQQESTTAVWTEEEPPVPTGNGSTPLSGPSRPQVELVLSLVAGMIFISIVVTLLCKKCYDTYQKRHYSRIDYLINDVRRETD